jgi:hypothetical protein
LVQAGVKSRSDPIWGSGDAYEEAANNTPEAILERDLASRKPVKQTLDYDVIPETMDSLSWAEKQIGVTLKPPTKTVFEIEMDKLGDEHKFTYDETLDPDVVSTLASGKLAEDEYYRN